ncbi:MAG TPA: protein-L-isoaspartate(D-aspartate) O-methyltransferase [Pirellulaceae bacterium]|jgi:protein-L-isoaspartate(D-aspartate) O-methyltransferase|nr:protein-L-isoaspartate(D-aspartate) O-methyltransferase [Pirellulaceae bacterium]
MSVRRKIAGFSLGLLLALSLGAGADPIRSAPPARASDPTLAARERMVKMAVTGVGVTTERVVEAMRRTPRHEFVPPAERSKAYLDMALPIGEGQTISSPFIVSYMTESLDPQPDDKVLEIGTGSGYQAAVLSGLVKEVYSIEIVESLGLQAAKDLERLGYENVQTKVGDGYLGWPEHAPFDKIIVTCSPDAVPTPLVEQLREGGLMVIPIGDRYQQTLVLMRKENGELVSQRLKPTLFVPMTGEAEEKRQTLPPKPGEIVNGSFEADGFEQDYVPGWYYIRQANVIEESDAPEGRRFLRFHTAERGRPALLLQGASIDGARTPNIVLRAAIRATKIGPGASPEEFPALAVTFYDEKRDTVASGWIGPIRDTRGWEWKSQRIAVPPTAREMIVRAGLFGATGTLDVDAISVIPVSN